MVLNMCFAYMCESPDKPSWRFLETLTLIMLPNTAVRRYCGISTGGVLLTNVFLILRCPLQASLSYYVHQLTGRFTITSNASNRPSLKQWKVCRSPCPAPVPGLRPLCHGRNHNMRPFILQPVVRAFGLWQRLKPSRP